MFKNIQNKIASYLSKTTGNQRRDAAPNINFNLLPSTPSYTYSRRLNQFDLESIYASEGIGKRIVDCIVEDGMRSFIECDSDLLAEMTRIDAKGKIEKAGKFGRLFGGAVLVAMIDDGQEHDKPLRLDKLNNSSAIHKIHTLQVYDRHQVTFTNQDINVDSYSKYFLEPEWFTIHLSGGFSIERVTLRVHRSRCFVFGGEGVTNKAKMSNLGWEMPVLNKCYTALQNYLESQDCAVSVQRDFVQVVFKIKDFLQDLTEDSAAQEWEKRLQMLNILKHYGNKNAIAVDAEFEDYTKNSSNMSGFSDATDRIAEYVCATSGIPVARLYGRTSGGLNTTGQGDMQNYYDTVRSWRNDQAKPCIDWLIDIISAQQSWKKHSTNLQWEFPSLTAPSELEQAQIRKTYAEIDGIYADRSAIDMRDAYHERFGHGKFHENIKISTITDEELEVDVDNLDLIDDNNDKEQELEQKKVSDIIHGTYKKVKKSKE